MNKLMTRLTLFALLATAISIAPAASPAFAAQMGGAQVDCNDPAMKTDPACMGHHKPGPKDSMSTTNTTTGGTTTGGATTTGGTTSTGGTTTTNDTQTKDLTLNQGNGDKPVLCPGGQKPLRNGSCPPPLHSPSNGKGPFNGPSDAHNDQPSFGANGFFNFSPRQHDDFHQRFRSFNFGFFPLPGFSITLGTPVPHHYGLRRVPYGIYHYYPQFRGYLFFVTRNGDIVIVSPRSYRIVAIL